MDSASVTKKLRDLGFTDGKLGKDDFVPVRALAAYSLHDKDGSVVVDADNLAGLRSSLASQFGILLQSTGDTPDSALTCIIFQTIGASPSQPYLVSFDQHILDPFTGPGQFDLVERDARRRVFDGASAGGTPVLTSETMNFQVSDGDGTKFIKLGINPGRYYLILSRQSANQVTLNDDIILPSSGLTLTMDGADESEVTIATKSGFTNGDTTGGWSRLKKAIPVDKTYSVVFVPGTAGGGIFSVNVQGLVPIPIPIIKTGVVQGIPGGHPGPQ